MAATLEGLKVAVIHEWLFTWAGSEKVTAGILELLPQADLFVGVYDPEAARKHFPDREIKATFLQRLPSPLRSRFRMLLPLFPSAFEALDLGGYDLVITSSHAFAKCVIPPEDAVHLCYCYTPPRYLWHQRKVYARRVHPFFRPLWKALCSYLRAVDFSAAQRVDYFVSVSETAARRIRRYYRREAKAVYPPVEIGKFKPSSDDDGFYLFVSRLVPYKRADLAVQALSRLKRKLIVVGEGPERARLQRMASNEVKFLGWVSDDELLRLYHRCKALVFPAEEDFGIVMVEAQAAGKPVVAYSRGGASEIVSDGETGLLFHEQTVEALCEAVLKLERMRFDPHAIRRNAERFSPERFREGMREALVEALSRAR